MSTKTRGGHARPRLPFWQYPVQVRDHVQSSRAECVRGVVRQAEAAAFELGQQIHGRLPVVNGELRADEEIRCELGKKRADLGRRISIRGWRVGARAQLLRIQTHEDQLQARHVRGSQPRVELELRSHHRNRAWNARRSILDLLELGTSDHAHR